MLGSGFSKLRSRVHARVAGGVHRVHALVLPLVRPRPRLVLLL